MGLLFVGWLVGMFSSWAIKTVLFGGDIWDLSDDDPFWEETPPS